VLRFSEHLAGAEGEAIFRHACAMGLERIVSKRVASRYKSGSCLAWVKAKNPAYERRTGRQHSPGRLTQGAPAALLFRCELFTPGDAAAAESFRPASAQ